MRTSRPVVLLIAALTLASCGLFATRIGSIVGDSRAYDGRTVTIAGEVKESANLLVVRTYVVDDGTGSLTVITGRAVPRAGAHVRVTGVVHQAFALGDESLVVLKESGDGE